jgi:hypothetical protein
LVSGTRTLDSKPMRIIMDPAVRMTVAERTRWNAIASELHDVQRRGNEVQQQLSALFPQMSTVAGSLASNTSVPAGTKSQFEALQKDFDAVRVKFGVPPQAAQGGRGGGGGGGRGGGAPDQNLLNRVGAAKGAVMGIWEAPSDAVSRQAASARTGLLAAISEAQGVIARARTMASALKAHNITLNVQ